MLKKVIANTNLTSKTITLQTNEPLAIVDIMLDLKDELGVYNFQQLNNRQAFKELLTVKQVIFEKYAAQIMAKLFGDDQIKNTNYADLKIDSVDILAEGLIQIVYCAEADSTKLSPIDVTILFEKILRKFKAQNPLLPSLILDQLAQKISDHSIYEFKKYLPVIHIATAGLYPEKAALAIYEQYQALTTLIRKTHPPRINKLRELAPETQKKLAKFAIHSNSIAKKWKIGGQSFSLARIKNWQKGIMGSYYNSKDRKFYALIYTMGSIMTLGHFFMSNNMLKTAPILLLSYWLLEHLRLIIKGAKASIPPIQDSIKYTDQMLRWRRGAQIKDIVLAKKPKHPALKFSSQNGNIFLRLMNRYPDKREELNIRYWNFLNNSRKKIKAYVKSKLPSNNSQSKQIENKTDKID